MSEWTPIFKTKEEDFVTRHYKSHDEYRAWQKQNLRIRLIGMKWENNILHVISEF